MVDAVNRMTLQDYLAKQGLAKQPNKRAGRGKYNADRVSRDGLKFDSKAEALHYDNLAIQVCLGEIVDLECQPEFPLFDGATPILMPSGKQAKYIADFRYTVMATGESVVEDVKGGKGGKAVTDTSTSKLKRAIVKTNYGVDVKIIVKG